MQKRPRLVNVGSWHNAAVRPSGLKGGFVLPAVVKPMILLFAAIELRQPLSRRGQVDDGAVAGMVVVALLAALVGFVAEVLVMGQWSQGRQVIFITAKGTEV